MEYKIKQHEKGNKQREGINVVLIETCNQFCREILKIMIIIP